MDVGLSSFPRRVNRITAQKNARRVESPIPGVFIASGRPLCPWLFGYFCGNGMSISFFSAFGLVALELFFAGWF